jgi:replicative DNA helicase
MNIDKQLPQAIDIEKMVLGTCLIYPDAIYEVNLKEEMFYDNSHKTIFKAIQNCRPNCDLFTVTQNLLDNKNLEEVGGAIALTELTTGVISEQYLSHYSLIIREKWMLREYNRLGYKLANMAYQEDLKDVVEFAENELFQLSDFTHTKEPQIISKCIDTLLADVEKIYNKEKSLVGVPSGFTNIDRITGGWQPGNLIIIAGRPSMGKTALGLTLALNASKMNYPVCLFSLEMSENELATRFLSGASGYTNVEIRNAKLDFEKLSKSSIDIALLPIYIDDTAAIELFELRSKIKKMIIRYGIKLVIVDYLGLIKQNAESREQEVSKISRGLKAIAKEFNIPVIAMAQLNREVEKRSGNLPKLGDLRDSGNIEQDADIVCFVYRPIYYNLKTMVFDNKEMSTKGLMILDCGKNRNGGLFSIPLNHNESMTQITDEGNGKFN